MNIGSNDTLLDQILRSKKVSFPLGTQLERDLVNAGFLPEDNEEKLAKIKELLNIAPRDDVEQTLRGSLQTLYVLRYPGTTVIDKISPQPHMLYGIRAGDVVIEDSVDGGFFAEHMRGGRISMTNMYGDRNLNSLEGGKITIDGNVIGNFILKDMNGGVVHIRGYVSSEISSDFYPPVASMMEGGLLFIDGSAKSTGNYSALGANYRGVIVVGKGVEGRISRNRGVIIVPDKGVKQHDEEAVVITGKGAEKVVDVIGKYLFEHNKDRIIADFAWALNGVLNEKPELYGKVREIVRRNLEGKIFDEYVMKGLYLADMDKINSVYGDICRSKEGLEPIIERLENDGLTSKGVLTPAFDLQGDITSILGNKKFAGKIEASEFLKKYNSSGYEMVYRPLLDYAGELASPKIGIVESAWKKISARA